MTRVYVSDIVTLRIEKSELQHEFKYKSLNL